MRPGSHHSPGTRARMSRAVRQAMANPDIRRKISERTKAAMADPAVRRKISDGMAKRRLRDAEIILLRLVWGATSAEVRAKFLAEVIALDSDTTPEQIGSADE